MTSKVLSSESLIIALVYLSTSMTVSYVHQLYVCVLYPWIAAYNGTVATYMQGG